MNDAVFYEEKSIPSEVIPYQNYTEIRWTLDAWANRYAIYRTTNKRKLIGHAQGLGFFHDRERDDLIGEYEVIAERLGDISFEDGSIRLVQDENLAAQDMMMRMESNKGDWKEHAELGANLSQYIGKRNTRATASEIEDSVREACMYGGRFDGVEVRVIPTQADRVSVYTFTEDAVASKEVEL